MSMEYRALGTLCTITSSKRIFADQYVESGIPFYRSKEIIERNNNADISEPLFISPEVYASIKAKFGAPKEGDLLLTSVGTIGIPYIVKKECFYFKDGNLTWMKDFSHELSSRYAYYWLSSSFGKESLINRCIGSSQAALTIDILKKYKILVPDRTTQDAIVSILSSYDKLIEVNNKRIKVLEQMAENLYKEWFVRFHFPGYETAEFENDTPRGWSMGKGIETKRPKNWHYGQFAEFGSFVRGKNITSAEMINGVVPVVSAGIDPSGYHNESNVKGKSLTISASGANAGYLKYNLDDIWAADCSYYQSTNYFWFAYHSLKFLQPVINNLQCGAAQPHVHPKQINRLSVIIPADIMIRGFCNIVEPMYDEIKRLKKLNNNLAKQRDLLLPRLMSGKLEV